MMDPKEKCCLCLNVNSKPYIDMFFKNGDGLTCFEKITSSLYQIANVFNELSCKDCMVCSECCSTIDMIYNFNISCLRNVKLYINGTLIEESVAKKETFTLVSVPSNTQLEETLEEEEEDESSIDISEAFLEIELNECPRKEDLREDKTVSKYHSLKPDENKQPEISRLETTKNKSTINHTRNKGFTCKVCNKTIKRKSNFDVHMRVHTDLKTYMCEECGKIFGQKHHLKMHMLIHIGKKPYECNTCKKKFRQQGALAQHKLTHTGQKEYLCDQCHKLFTHKHHLIRHKRLHSGEKPYTCNFCDKTFSSNSHLADHRRVHTGERPYSCDYCSKTFSVKKTLDQHRLTHNEDKTYSCSFCSKKFKQISTLVKHKRKIHTAKETIN